MATELSLAAKYFRVMDELERFTNKLRKEIGSFAVITVDSDECELHIENIPDDFRLSDTIQTFIVEHGFMKVRLFHEDVDDKGGWVSQYDFTNILPTKGWRKRWVADDTVKTTRSLSPCDNPELGYFEISSWPISWTNKDWLESGYMRIVPDLIDAAPHIPEEDSKS